MPVFENYKSEYARVDRFNKGAKDSTIIMGDIRHGADVRFTMFRELYNPSRQNSGDQRNAGFDVKAIGTGRLFFVFKSNHRNGLVDYRDIRISLEIVRRNNGVF